MLKDLTHMHLPLRGIGRSARHGAMVRAPCLRFGECNSIQTCILLKVLVFFTTLEASGWYTRCRIKKSSWIWVSEHIPSLQPRDSAPIRPHKKKSRKSNFFMDRRKYIIIGQLELTADQPGTGRPVFRSPSLVIEGFDRRCRAYFPAMKRCRVRIYLVSHAGTRARVWFELDLKIGDLFLFFKNARNILSNSLTSEKVSAASLISISLSPIKFN